MTTKYYVDSTGHYLGSFSGFEGNRPELDENGDPVLDEDGNVIFHHVDEDPVAPDGGIEVPVLPDDGRQIWNFETEQFDPLVTSPPVDPTDPDNPPSVFYMKDEITNEVVSFKVSNGVFMKTQGV